MAMTEIWMPSPNYSSGITHNKVVLHTTQGADTIRALGNFFAQSSSGVSSHFGADNYERGVVGAYVYESNKAWTQGNANPYCLSNELCGYAEWSRDTWLGQKLTLVYNAADWVGWMCGKYGVPIRSLSASEAQDPNVKGVCDHVDLGSWGGGHWDCGSGFPMDKVIEWAKNGTPDGGGTPPQPEPAPVTEEDLMIELQPGPDARTVGMSWNGDAYSSIGFCADASVLPTPVRIRCAVRVISGGWAVTNVVLDAQHTKVVVKVASPSDGCSMVRQDDNPVVIVPNFALR